MDTMDSHEQARLTELRSYNILDSPTEADYEHFVDFASRLCKTPAAIVTLVDEHRQWFKAVKGLDFRESLRELSFCAHVVQNQAPVIIHDTLTDPRFHANPFVLRLPGLRFYAGVPIISPRGFVLGSVAVIDFEPRTLEPAQLAGLDIVAEQVMAKLEIRRQQSELDEISLEREKANQERDAISLKLAHTNERLLNSYEHISDGFCLLGIDWKITYVNGVAASMARKRISDLIGTIFWDVYPFLIGTPFELHYRRAALEQTPIEFEQLYEPLGRWLEVRIFPSSEGLAVYFRDITKRHRSEEQLKLLENCMGRLNDIVMITEFDPLGIEHARISYVNDAFRRRTGFQEDDIVGKTQRSLASPSLDRDGNLITLTAEPPSPLSGRHERLHITKSGRPFWVEQETVQVTDLNGASTHFISVARDITDRK